MILRSDMRYKIYKILLNELYFVKTFFSNFINFNLELEVILCKIWFLQKSNLYDLRRRTIYIEAYKIYEVIIKIVKR